MKRRNKTPAAFTLLELLAVVTILGIISALIVPRLILSTDRTKEATCHHARGELNMAVERYYVHKGIWPANDLSDIATDPEYFPEGIPVCPLTGEAYRLDPATHRVTGHAGASDHTP